jgi:hypothetical protein
MWELVLPRLGYIFRLVNQKIRAVKKKECFAALRAWQS